MRVPTKIIEGLDSFTGHRLAWLCDRAWSRQLEDEANVWAKAEAEARDEAQRRVIDTIDREGRE